MTVNSYLHVCTTMMFRLIVISKFLKQMGSVNAVTVCMERND